MPIPPLSLRLPATSANLGPGFDALGLALSLSLSIEAELAPAFSIHASGRDAALTASLDNNLILDTYRDVLRQQSVEAPPLALSLVNEIPLGMGCGSSAAALCAGVLLASHFGALGWTTDQVLNEAARREGHPDNVAACLLGGLTVSKSIPADPAAGKSSRTFTATFGLDLAWRLLLALPTASLSTSAARKLLPGEYSRADAVLNIQSTALLVSAFALNQPSLLQTATEDRLHQPYRAAACPLLGLLLPMTGTPGVHSVTLSGAGPSVLLIVDRNFPSENVSAAAGSALAEVLDLQTATGATWESR